jgi:hypothetical protein
MPCAVGYTALWSCSSHPPGKLAIPFDNSAPVWLLRAVCRNGVLQPSSGTYHCCSWSATGTAKFWVCLDALF